MIIDKAHMQKLPPAINYPYNDYFIKRQNLNNDQSKIYLVLLDIFLHTSSAIQKNVPRDTASENPILLFNVVNKGGR